MAAKTIIIIVAILLVVGVGLGVYFYMQNTNGSAPAAGDNATSTGAGSEVVLPASRVLSGTPTGTLLTIGTPDGSVQVNNFYLSNPMVTDGGETIILASTTSYLITYNTTDSSFWVGIEPGQFNAVRPIAEQAFLSALGVSSTGACKLSVSVGAFYSATSSLNGRSFPLGLCGDLNATR